MNSQFFFLGVFYFVLAGCSTVDNTAGLQSIQSGEVPTFFELDSIPEATAAERPYKRIVEFLCEDRDCEFGVALIELKKARKFDAWLFKNGKPIENSPLLQGLDSKDSVVLGGERSIFVAINGRTKEPVFEGHNGDSAAFEFIIGSSIPNKLFSIREGRERVSFNSFKVQNGTVIMGTRRGPANNPNFSSAIYFPNTDSKHKCTFRGKATDVTDDGILIQLEKRDGVISVEMLDRSSLASICDVSTRTQFGVYHATEWAVRSSIATNGTVWVSHATNGAWQTEYFTWSSEGRYSKPIHYPFSDRFELRLKSKTLKENVLSDPTFEVRSVCDFELEMKEADISALSQFETDDADHSADCNLDLIQILEGDVLVSRYWILDPNLSEALSSKKLDNVTVIDVYSGYGFPITLADSEGKVEHLINEGATVISTQLPGDGANGWEFANRGINNRQLTLDAIHQIVAQEAKTGKKIVLRGHSFGSQLVLAAAYCSELPVDGIILRSTRWSEDSSLSKLFQRTLGLAECPAHKRLNTVPMALIIHGDSDARVPAKSLIYLQRYLADKVIDLRALLIPSMSHDYEARNTDQIETEQVAEINVLQKVGLSQQPNAN